MAKKRGLGKGLAALIPTLQVDDAKKNGGLKKADGKNDNLKKVNASKKIDDSKKVEDSKKADDKNDNLKKVNDSKKNDSLKKVDTVKKEYNKNKEVKNIKKNSEKKENTDKTVKKEAGNNVNKIIKKDNEELSLIKTIAVEKIDINPDQPRKSFDEEALMDLSESIKKYGILQPIVVKKRTIPGKAPYEILAGERRYRAAKLAGLKEVPVVLRETTEEDALLSVIENVQREDLTPYEEALAYKKIMQDRMMTQQEIADAMGKSRAYIANIIRLLKLDEASMEDLKKGLLTSSQARALLSEPDLKKRAEYREMLTKGTINVNEMEKKAGKKRSDNKNVFLTDLENRLSEALETQVQIHKKQKGWAIQVICYTKEDMDRFLERLEK